MQDSVNVLGVNIANVTLVQAVDAITRAADDRRSLTQFAFVNADCLNIVQGDDDYRRVLDNAAAVYGDGSGVRYACKLTGQHIVDNVNGTDLFPLLCEEAAKQGKSIFFLGGRPGVAFRAAERAARRYPGLRIAGYQHGFFDEKFHDLVVERVNASRADILLVALGAPKQEKFIASLAPRLDVGAAVGVGGLFDFLGQEVDRAPVLMRRLGLEWLVRWFHEPKRLLKRYLIGNPLFLYRVVTGRRPVATEESTTTGSAEDFRSQGSRFDLWQDFEVLDATQEKYLAAARGRKPGKASIGYWWQTRSYLFLKRFVDVVTASLALLLLSPVFLLTALAIYLEDRGPITFSQQRVGFRGRPFTMFKFRSMYVDADARKAALASQNESAEGVLFKMKQDPRITRVGRIIRKFSIDELPQLLNVLRGDMTLVGPRPPVPAEVDQYTLSQRGRLEVVPGITCTWQVSGRSDIDFLQQVELDLDYIRQRSVRKDVELLVRTVPAVLTAKGAY